MKLKETSATLTRHGKPVKLTVIYAEDTIETATGTDRTVAVISAHNNGVCFPLSDNMIADLEAEIASRVAV